MQIRGEPSINIAIPNYNFVHVDSATKAGSVAMYISSKYKFSLDHKLELNLNGCEDIWINLDINQAKKLTIGTIYWHPNSDNDSVVAFTESLCSSMNKLIKLKDTFYIQRYEY